MSTSGVAEGGERERTGGRIKRDGNASGSSTVAGGGGRSSTGGAVSAIGFGDGERSRVGGAASSVGFGERDRSRAGAGVISKVAAELGTISVVSPLVLRGGAPPTIAAGRGVISAGCIIDSAARGGDGSVGEETTRL